jgi:peptide/nickel transport system substrate-binding protein
MMDVSSRRIGTLAAGLLLAMLLAAGCAPPAAEKNELVIAHRGMPLTLMPHTREEVITNSVLMNMFESLAGFDADMKITPLLAVSWENPDDLTWLFKIRPGVRFHDGTPMTADDVVFSLERARTHPASALRSNCATISSITRTGDDTVKIVTARPSPILLHKLTNAFVMPRRHLERVGPEAFARHPVGTGPYRFESATGEAIRMFAWNDYWGGRPDFPRLIITRHASPAEAVQMLLDGRADIVSDISPELAREIERNPQQKPMIQHRPGLAIRQLAMDTTRPPFNRRQVREALSLAIDRPRLVERILHGFGQPANQMVPHAVFGYHPSLPELPYDPDRARRLLAAAGHPKGIALTLLVAASRARLGEELQRQAAAAGIRLELDIRDRQSFFDAADTAPFLLMGFNSTSGDASDLMDDLFHTTGGSFGRDNRGRYSNPEVDRLIEALGGLLNQPQRLHTMQRLMVMIMQDLPRVPLFVEDEIYGVSPAVSWQPRLDMRVLAKEVRRPAS